MNNSKLRSLIALCLIMLLAFNTATFAFAENEGEEGGESEAPETTVVTEEPVTDEPITIPSIRVTTTTQKVTTTEAPTKKTTTTTKKTTEASRGTTTEAEDEPQATRQTYEQVYNTYIPEYNGELETNQMGGIFDDDTTEEEKVKEDYTIDLKKTDKSLNGEFGYFGPFTSDDIVGMGSESGLIYDTKVTDGYVGFDFDSSRCAETYKYLVLTLRSTDDSVLPVFTLTIGNVTKKFTEWELEDGSKPDKAIPQIFTDYIIDLDANGVTNLLNEDYDFIMKNDETGNELVTVMGMIFTDTNPGGKKTANTKKSSLLKAIIVPVILIVISLGVIIYVNFFLFKRKKYEDNRVRGGKNGKKKPYNSSQRPPRRR